MDLILLSALYVSLINMLRMLLNQAGLPFKPLKIKKQSLPRSALIDMDGRKAKERRLAREAEQSAAREGWEDVDR